MRYEKAENLLRLCVMMASRNQGVSIEMIAKVLNHSSPSVTMAYLGITKKQVMDTYLEYEL